MATSAGAWAFHEPGHGLSPLMPHAPDLLRVVLGLSLAFVLAVVAAHPFVRKLERRLGLTVLLSSGLPFLAMGVVFHLPSVGVLTDDVVKDLRPALEFGLGWLGFVVGMQFDVRELDAMPPKTGTVVVAESAIPFFAVAVVCFVARVALDPYVVPSDIFTHRAYFFGAGGGDSLRDALALGACAAPAAPVAAVAIARSSGSVAAQIVGRVTALNDVAGVVVIGLICAYFRPGDAASAWQLPHIAWLFVTIGMGGTLGILTYVLVRSAKSAAEEMALLLGAIGISAGLSGFLGISPLVTCAIAGALLTNLPNKSIRRLKETILQVERPLYLIFLLVAGALWDPRAWEGWILVPIFVSSRVAGKLLGAIVAKRTGPPGLPDAATLGLALSPQSPIAIATIVSYVTLYRPLTASAPALSWLMTACIGGAVLTEIVVQAIARARGGLAFVDLRHPSMVSMVSMGPPPTMPTDPGNRMIRAIFLLAVTVLLIAAARSFLPDENVETVGSGAALAFGFVLLAALQSGTIFSGFRLPRLTGYLACGFLAGPSVFNFVTEDMVKDLKLVNGVAIGLIALSAGGGANFKRLRGRFRAILSIGGICIAFAILLISAAVFALARFLPFMDGMDVMHRGVIALTMGVVLAALSPTVTLALISETGSEGPISETLLGVVVVADLAIVIAFAGVNALANKAFGTASTDGVSELMIHIFGSIAAGAVVGVLFAVYMKKVNQRIALFVFGVCFLCAEAGTRLHLDPLLICLTAGLFLENVTDIEGSKLVHEIEAASMPVFAVFFAVAGAGLHWDLFKSVAPIALALALVRAVALFMGATLGMAIGAVPLAQRKTIPYGLLSQSGVAIGLCILVSKHFVGWGERASTCLLGAVMLNEMFGPILFRNALLKSGEAGRKEAVVGGH